MDLRRCLVVGIIGILLACLIPVQPVKATDVLVSQTVLRPKSTFYADAGWTPYPSDGILWNKTLTNDGNTTYITCATAWAMVYFDLTDWTDPGYANETIEITWWGICLGISAVQPASAIHQDGAIQSVSSWYDMSAIVMMRTFAAKNVWENHTLKIGEYCPWTTAKWTQTSINQIYIKLWPNTIIAGSLRVTETALLVNVTVPASEETVSFGTIGLFGILIFLAAVAVVKVARG
jgi:hypothetical protein